jgi:hypothetical protein
MKPTSRTAGNRSWTGDNQIIPRGFPVIDSAYQAISLEEYRGGCADTRHPSFRNISNGYFKSEARRSFITEAAFFVSIVIVSTWPVLQSIRAMSDLIRAYAAF